MNAHEMQLHVTSGLMGLFWGFLLIFPAQGEEAETSARKPNILIALSDDQSWPHASVYGARELKTPAFDQVAQRGVAFENAYVASPGCSPSRAALLTGLHTWQIREAGTHASSFPKDLVVFPELLEESGYKIGFTGKGWGPGNLQASGRDRNPAGPAYSKIRAKGTPQGINALDYAANFAAFIEERGDSDQPFYFWFGSFEPHRPYKNGIGIERGKNPDEVEVPGFLPDHPVTRSDILDYYVEIEWFDSHLQRMLDLLEERGELDNTLVIVSSDNGMPFARAKANCYEPGIHVPLAISWPQTVPGGRAVKDLVGFVDLTATILDAAGIQVPAESHRAAGRSLLPVLQSEEQGWVDSERTAVFSARERHSSSRYDNWTYPQRAMRTRDFLLIRNFRPDRWPAGDPQKYDKPGVLGPMHGGYHDIDPCPSFTMTVEQRQDPDIAKYFLLAVDKRPEIELFAVQEDPYCLNNLADHPDYQQQRKELEAQLEQTLRETKDPRILDGGDVWETYPRYSPIRDFPKPPEKLPE